MRQDKRRAQSIVEYVVLISVAILAFMGMKVYLKRAVMGKIKDVSDQIGEQFTPMVDYTITVSQTSSREDNTNMPGGPWSETRDIGASTTTRTVTDFDSGDLYGTSIPGG